MPLTIYVPIKHRVCELKDKNNNSICANKFTTHHPTRKYCDEHSNQKVRQEIREKTTVNKAESDLTPIIELICEVHKHDGTTPIGKLTGLWHRKLNEQWEFWVNGQMKPLSVRGDAKVGPGDCYVEYNGWPFALFSMIHGDGLIGIGQCANADEFEAILRGVLA